MSRYKSIVLVIPSTRSSLARESPMGLGRCGDLVENKPTFLPPNLGGQTLDRTNSFSFLWNTKINLKWTVILEIRFWLQFVNKEEGKVLTRKKTPAHLWQKNFCKSSILSNFCFTKLIIIKLLFNKTGEIHILQNILRTGMSSLFSQLYYTLYDYQ